MTNKRNQDIFVNSIEPPIYQNASYYFDNKEDVVTGLHDRTKALGRYGRYSNPTWVYVEDMLTDLNRSEASLVFASGMSAHLTTFLTFLESGDEVLIPAETYRQVRNIFFKILPKYGIKVHEFSITDPDAFVNYAKSLSGKLKLVHLEMPSSPHMYVIDLEKVTSTLPNEVVVTLDSSFAPPPNFYALDWGVDIVLFSATKYLGGHGDIMAGAISGKRNLIEQIRWYRDTTGGIIDGVVANTLKRSLYTLDLRMEKVNKMAKEVADFLDTHPKVDKVYYTGLESHPHYQLAQKYLHGHGGVITFELGISEQKTAEFVDRLKVPFMASNFGAPHTLVEQSTFFTYFEYSDVELKNIGVDRSTVRLALGFTQESKNIINDLASALELV